MSEINEFKKVLKNHENRILALEKLAKSKPKSILKLEPKDVKYLGISRQTLWNVKQKLSLNLISKISNNVKLQFLYVVQ